MGVSINVCVCVCVGEYKRVRVSINVCVRVLPMYRKVCLSGYVSGSMWYKIEESIYNIYV